MRGLLSHTFLQECSTHILGEYLFEHDILVAGDRSKHTVYQTVAGPCEVIPSTQARNSTACECRVAPLSSRLACERASLWQLSLQLLQDMDTDGWLLSVLLRGSQSLFGYCKTGKRLKEQQGASAGTWIRGRALPFQCREGPLACNAETARSWGQFPAMLGARFAPNLRKCCR